MCVEPLENGKYLLSSRFSSISYFFLLANAKYLPMPRHGTIDSIIESFMSRRGFKTAPSSSQYDLCNNLIIKILCRGGSKIIYLSLFFDEQVFRKICIQSTIGRLSNLLLACIVYKPTPVQCYLKFLLAYGCAQPLVRLSLFILYRRI